MSERPSSSRTTKYMWFSPSVPSSRTSLRDVDAGDGIGRHVPGRGDAPVAGIGQTGGIVSQRRRLLGNRRGFDRRDVARPVPLVIAHAIDVDAIVRRDRVDLEVDGLALIDADIGRETFDGGRRPIDAPHALRGSGQLIFRDDPIGGCLVEAGDVNGHRRRSRCALTIGDRIAETVWRHIRRRALTRIEGLERRARIVGNGIVGVNGRAALRPGEIETRHRQRIAIGIGVVREDVDRHRAVFVGRGGVRNRVGRLIARRRQRSG